MPRRRCVGCGRIAPKAELLRIALEPGGSDGARRAVIDSRALMGGRGAYLCRAGELADAPAAECLSSATERRGIARALRAAVSLDPKLVESVSR